VHVQKIQSLAQILYPYAFSKLLPILFLFLLLLLLANTPSLSAFSFQNVIDQASKLAKKPYQGTPGHVPDFLLDIDYDEWRDIRFKGDQALWLKDKTSFTVQFFHPGLLYNRTVTIYTVDSTGVRPVSFSPDLFDYGDSEIKDRIPFNLGFAGFRLHYPINTSELPGRSHCFLGCQLFSGCGGKPDLWPFRPGPCNRYRPSFGRRVSLLYHFLAGETGARRSENDPLRALGQSEPHRRLPLFGSTWKRHHC
jgi:glucan biosynthesis protein